VLSRIVLGGRISLGVALAVVVLAGVAGSAAGLVSGYRLGLVDQGVMRLADLQMAFPPLLLAVFLLYLAGPSIRNLVLLLVAFGWVGFARIARAQTLSLRTRPFVEGAVALGCTEKRVLLRHILPHLLPALLVTAVFEFAAVMLAEAGLSFLGLGVQPPDASWGLMLAQGQSYITSGAWWLIAVPGLAIFLVTFPANLASRWAQELMG
jgi:peptide/nickel transport system permease protein